MSSSFESRLIDYKTVCQMLSVGKNSFYAMRQSGRFPIHAIRLGGNVRYDRLLIEQWIEASCPENFPPADKLNKRS